MFYKTLPYEKLKSFCREVFRKYGFQIDESEIIADSLLCADLFGIESHGIQRLIRYHNEILGGYVDIRAKPVTVCETKVSAVIDAAKSMGQLISQKSMRMAIAKAKESGIGMVAVKNSNHYGIAGYYAQMAAEDDLLGMCMTNTEAIGVPIYGKRAMLGTNPIALAFPAQPRNFLYDAATTVVPRGKLEVYSKINKPMPNGWAVDVNGAASTDAGEIIGNIISKAGGGISPLGGNSELFGGHKGYGLGIIVDLFCGILSGGLTSNHINREPKKIGTTHFFMAMDYGLFGDRDAIRENFSAFLQELRDSPKADGEDRIYTHGEKEYESMEYKLVNGIPANEMTYEEMRMIASYHSINFDEYFG